MFRFSNLLYLHKHQTMTCELNKDDLWCLLRGMEPPTYEWAFKLHQLGIGTYKGGMDESFSYHSLLSIPKLSEYEMWELYQQMKAKHEEMLTRYSCHLQESTGHSL